MAEIKLEAAINLLYFLYTLVRDAIAFLLEATIFKARPELAAQFGDAVTLLTALTAVYVIMTLFEAAKKIIRFILILGWGLLILAMVVSVSL
jgi:hypothetical protein